MTNQEAMGLSDEQMKEWKREVEPLIERLLEVMDKVTEINKKYPESPTVRLIAVYVHSILYNIEKKSEDVAVGMLIAALDAASIAAKLITEMKKDRVHDCSSCTDPCEDYNIPGRKKGEYDA